MGHRLMMSSSGKGREPQGPVLPGASASSKGSSSGIRGVLSFALHFYAFVSFCLPPSLLDSPRNTQANDAILQASECQGQAFPGGQQLPSMLRHEAGPPDQAEGTGGRRCRKRPGDRVCAQKHAEQERDQKSEGEKGREGFAMVS